MGRIRRWGGAPGSSSWPCGLAPADTTSAHQAGQAALGPGERRRSAHRFYDKNAWEVSQGGLQYTHYGRDQCHNPGARDPAVSLHGGPEVGFVDL